MGLDRHLPRYHRLSLPPPPILQSSLLSPSLVKARHIPRYHRLSPPPPLHPYLLSPPLVRARHVPRLPPRHRRRHKLDHTTTPPAPCARQRPRPQPSLPLLEGRYPRQVLLRYPRQVLHVAVRRPVRRLGRSVRSMRTRTRGARGEMDRQDLIAASLLSGGARERPVATRKRNPARHRSRLNRDAKLRVARPRRGVGPKSLQQQQHRRQQQPRAREPLPQQTLLPQQPLPQQPPRQQPAPQLSPQQLPSQQPLQHQPQKQTRRAKPPRNSRGRASARSTFSKQPCPVVHRCSCRRCLGGQMRQGGRACSSPSSVVQSQQQRPSSRLGGRRRTTTPGGGEGQCLLRRSGSAVVVAFARGSAG